MGEDHSEERGASDRGIQRLREREPVSLNYRGFLVTRNPSWSVAALVRNPDLIGRQACVSGHWISPVVERGSP